MREPGEWSTLRRPDVSELVAAELEPRRVGCVARRGAGEEEEEEEEKESEGRLTEEERGRDMSSFSHVGVG